MTKAATMKNLRFLCLVAAAAMVIATVMALVVPRVAHAAENEGITSYLAVLVYGLSNGSIWRFGNSATPCSASGACRRCLTPCPS